MTGNKSKVKSASFQLDLMKMLKCINIKTHQAF